MGDLLLLAPLRPGSHVTSYWEWRTGELADFVVGLYSQTWKTCCTAYGRGSYGLSIVTEGPGVSCSLFSVSSCRSCAYCKAVVSCGGLLGLPVSLGADCRTLLSSSRVPECPVVLAWTCSLWANLTLCALLRPGGQVIMLHYNTKNRISGLCKNQAC